LLLDYVYRIAYNDELKLLATGSADKSIKLHYFSEKKKKFHEVQHLKNIHERRHFLTFLFFKLREIFYSNNILQFFYILFVY